MSIDSFVSSVLEERKDQGLFRTLKTLEGAQDRIVSFNGKKLINFCSNNYLGLANDPRLKQAAIKAVEAFGTSSAASRLTCGSFRLHKELEEKIAKFKHSLSALVFNSGYVANLGLISSLIQKHGVIFSDRLNHASIVDAIILSRAHIVRYNHNDMSQLQDLLEKHKDAKQKLIVTDTVFSMDGDLADLHRIVNLAEKYHASVMVDEAHATGVLGPNGGGLVEELGLSDKIDIQMGTLSKALGSFGAFVCADENLVQYLINASRPFIYTTSLPAAVLAASIKAIEIIQKEPQQRQRLWGNIRFIKQGLADMGLGPLNSSSAIIPILTKENELTMEFSQRLFDRGIFIQGIRPPTVPKDQARLRLTVIASHTREDLERALAAIKKTAKELRLI
ncbi:MAG: 8-amino-7-oxononanoate synthase [Candidatus Omnitrophica bacterium]|nr:8-amino-7-oxononanoate synthase [Candidatus Omnitrophota bacterium]